MHFRPFKLLLSLLALHHASAEPHEAVEAEQCPYGRCPGRMPVVTVYCTETVTCTSVVTSRVIDYRTKTVNCVTTITTCPMPTGMPCLPTSSPATPADDQQDDGSGDDDEGSGDGGANVVANADQWPGRVCVRWRFGRCIRWRRVRRRRFRRRRRFFRNVSEDGVTSTTD